MKPRTGSLIDSAILVALDGIEERHTVAGWVSVARLRQRIPQRFADGDFDRAVRRLRGGDHVELLMDRYPPSAPHQAVRRLGSS